MLSQVRTDASPAAADIRLAASDVRSAQRAMSNSLPRPQDTLSSAGHPNPAGNTEENTGGFCKKLGDCLKCFFTLPVKIALGIGVCFMLLRCLLCGNSSDLANAAGQTIQR